MRKILLGLILLLLTTSAAYSQEPPQTLQLTIKSDKEVYSQGEDIKLSVTFKNNGGKDISFCKYILDYKLLKGIELKNKEGIIYKVIDVTKYKWPIVTKDDFVSLTPNEEYKIEIKFATIFSSDSTLWYGKPDYTSEYTKDLPVGIFQITVVYENVADYFQEPITKNGYTTTNNIPVKNAWTGTLISNSITIKVVEKKGIVEGDRCKSDDDCLDINCSKYNKGGLKEGFKQYCVNNKCKCMCYGCE